MPTTMITLTFSSTAGDFTGEFPVDLILGDVKKRVMEQFGLDPSKADQVIVTLDGRVLDETKTLEELNLPDGAVLVIERKEVTKI